MPGIKVLSSGAIQYNGKDINKFYIENLDLLQGRYSIATNNISAKDVASVEVFEYHQPVKALAETNPSDHAALNLKLKNSAKGTLNATVQLGIGADPLLWENELILLYFAKNKQNITTYKGNNSGNDVSSEFTDFYEDNDNTIFQGKFLSVLAPTPPDISEQRYLFNNVNTVNTNFLYLLPKEYQMTTNISYSHDIQKRKSYARSSYFLPNNNVLNIEEQLDAHQKMNQADAHLKITTNKENFYLTDAIKMSANWNDNKGIAICPDTINQNLETNTYNLSNLLEIVKTLPNKTTIHFRSFNGFMQTPQNLTVHPGVYTDILNPGDNFDRLLQNTVFNNFTSNTLVFYSISKHSLTQNYTIGMNINNQNLDSYLQAYQGNNALIYSIADSLKNDLHWQKYKAYITGEYVYNWNKFRIDAYLSASYNLLFVENQLSNKEKSIKQFLFNPGISVLYDLSRKWYAKASVETHNNLGNIQDAYTGYILQNYRLFNRNDGKIAENIVLRSTVSANYRNPLKALFGDINFLYEVRKSNMLKEQYFLGNLQMNNTLYQTVKSFTKGITGTISKNIYAWRANISLSGSFYNIASSLMSQRELIDYQYNILTVNPSINTQLTTWAGLSYVCLWNESSTNLKSSVSNSPGVRSVSNRIIPYLSIFKNVSFVLIYEHYYNNSVSEDKNRTFLDANIKYKLRNVDLMLSWTNILNSKEYITSIFDQTSQYTNIYEIRPSQMLLTARFKLF
jgi:hypothetical protein